MPGHMLQGSRAFHGVYHWISADSHAWLGRRGEVKSTPVCNANLESRLPTPNPFNRHKRQQRTRKVHFLRDGFPPRLGPQCRLPSVSSWSFWNFESDVCHILTQGSAAGLGAAGLKATRGQEHRRGHRVSSGQ